MRWLKHLTLAHEDEALAYALEKFGAEAYGIWWLVQCKIAARMEDGTKDTSSTYTARQWASSCYVSVERFKEIIDCIQQAKVSEMQRKGISGPPSFEISYDDIFITINSRNILKFRDEYSAKRERKESKKNLVRTDERKCPDILSEISGQNPRNVLVEQTTTEQNRTEQNYNGRTYRSDRRSCGEW